jgi:hypothetical protein
VEKERVDKRRGLLSELLYLVVEVRWACRGTLERMLRSVDGENCLANDFSFSGPGGLESMTGLSNCSLRCMSSLRIDGVICRVVWRAGGNLNTVQT